MAVVLPICLLLIRRRWFLKITTHHEPLKRMVAKPPESPVELKNPAEVLDTPPKSALSSAPRQAQGTRSSIG
jgi:hypothetical protein